MRRGDFNVIVAIVLALAVILMGTAIYYKFFYNAQGNLDSFQACENGLIGSLAGSDPRCVPSPNCEGLSQVGAQDDVVPSAIDKIADPTIVIKQAIVPKKSYYINIGKVGCQNGQYCCIKVSRDGALPNANQVQSATCNLQQGEWGYTTSPGDRCSYEKTGGLKLSLTGSPTIFYAPTKDDKDCVITKTDGTTIISSKISDCYTSKDKDGHIQFTNIPTAINLLSQDRDALKGEGTDVKLAMKLVVRTADGQKTVKDILIPLTDSANVPLYACPNKDQKDLCYGKYAFYGLTSFNPDLNTLHNNNIFCVYTAQNGQPTGDCQRCQGGMGGSDPCGLLSTSPMSRICADLGNQASERNKVCNGKLGVKVSDYLYTSDSNAKSLITDQCVFDDTDTKPAPICWPCNYASKYKCGAGTYS